MAECSALRAWAETLPVSDQPIATVSQIERHLEFLASALPSQKTDDEKGRNRFAVYVTLLSRYSNEALTYMSRKACETLRWFPVPSECLEMIREYRAPISERESTLLICGQFSQSAMETWIANVREGQPVGDVPEHWKRIAVEQDAMRRLTNGEYVSRALYHGPLLAHNTEG